MADAAQAQKSGSGSRALLWLLIVVLLGAVWWLASERNARKYTLSSRAGFLVVSRGHFFPTGTGVIGPDDPEGKLYAGIALPPGTKSFGEIEYDDEDALDRALYQMLSASAHELAKKGDAASFAEADTLAKRLSALRGLSAEELGDLTALRAELAFWSAGSDVQAAVASLADARRKLEEVRANGGEHAAAAGTLQGALEPLAVQLAQLGARFAPPPGSIAIPINSNPAPASGSGGAANPAANPSAANPAAAQPVVNATNSSDAGVPAPAAPPGAASPPGAPAASPSPEAPAQEGRASAPSSVSSGASRAKE